VEPEEQEKRAGPPAEINKVFVVLNPVAGVNNRDTIRDSVEKFCAEKRWDFDIHETKKDEDLHRVMKKALKDGVDLVIAAGGDGTVAGVVSGIAQSSVPLGILPAGTGNALARDLGIPITADAALELIGGEHDVKTMDAIQIGKDYYALNVSIGISAEIMEKTAREEKRRFGFLAYLWRGLQTLTRSRLHRFSVEVDDRKVQFRASEVMIANEKLMGLQPRIDGVEVSAEDGRLDAFIVRAQSLRDYLGVFTRFVRRSQPAYDSNLRYLPIREKIVIHTLKPVPVQADGEAIGVTPVEIRVVPQAIRVIVPPSSEPKENRS